MPCATKTIGPNPAVIMVKHLNEPLVPPRHRQPELDSGAQEIIATMMAKNPLDRYQSPAELLIDLENLAATRAGDPPPFPGGARRRRQRQPQPPPLPPTGPPRIIRRPDR